MSLSTFKAVALPLSLVAAGLFAIGGSVAAQKKGDEKAERPENAEQVASPEKAGDEKPENPSTTKRPKATGESMGGGAFGNDGVNGGAKETDPKTRLEIARLSATVAQYEENPQTKAVLEALDKPFTIRTNGDWTFDDLVKQIRARLATADDKRVPVYVDPRGIEEAGLEPDAPVVLDLEDVPLKLSLRLALKQLKLAYCVREGVIIISSPDGVLLELKEAEGELMGLHPDRVIIGPGGPTFMGTMGGMGAGMR